VQDGSAVNMRNCPYTYVLEHIRGISKIKRLHKGARHDILSPETAFSKTAKSETGFTPMMKVDDA
jgi:hypothetical protein